MSPLCCGNNTGQCWQSSKKKERLTDDVLQQWAVLLKAGRRLLWFLEMGPPPFLKTKVTSSRKVSGLLNIPLSFISDFFENVKHELQWISFTTGEIILILLACLLGLSVAALCTSLSECAKQKRRRLNPLPAFKKRKYDFIVVQGRVEEKLVIEKEWEDKGEVLGENEVDLWEKWFVFSSLSFCLNKNYLLIATQGSARGEAPMRFATAAVHRSSHQEMVVPHFRSNQLLWILNKEEEEEASKLHSEVKCHLVALITWTLSLSYEWYQLLISASETGRQTGRKLYLPNYHYHHHLN